MGRHSKQFLVAALLLSVVGAACSSPSKPTEKDPTDTMHDAMDGCEAGQCEDVVESEDLLELDERSDDVAIDPELDASAPDLADQVEPEDAADTQEVADTDLFSDEWSGEDISLDLDDALEDVAEDFDLVDEEVGDSEDIEPEVAPECETDDDCANDDLCDGLETCQDGGCVAGTALDCDDDNICTDDSCDAAKGCLFVPNDLACDDDDACTSVDQCLEGVCTGSGIVVCDDGNECTDDWCSSLTGCFFKPNEKSCDDGDVCTENDVCSQSLCKGVAVNCDDGNPCTNSACVPGVGCQSTGKSGPCDDGNPCTVGDNCAGGECQGGPPFDCDDDLDCTVDSCDPETLCVHTPDDSKCAEGSCIVGLGCTVLDDAAFPVPDTAQTMCYGNQSCGACPTSGQPFFGQDSHSEGAPMGFTVEYAGTATDNVTGLMWSTTPLKLSFAEAKSAASSSNLAGFNDWRLPTIKELYSLIRFDGYDPSACEEIADCALVPFIDTAVFDFEYGDTALGERLIDAQYISSTEYVATVMDSQPAAFGVNFADGRIKGYPSGNVPPDDTPKTFRVLLVRGDSGYGINLFDVKSDGTILDASTGLVWMKDDSEKLGAGAMNWEEALDWCENLEYGSYSDWRLPNAKELQSIVDYARSPLTSGSAAIDPVFVATMVDVEDSVKDYGFYWTSTTHVSNNGSQSSGEHAVYIGFGQCFGWMESLEGEMTLVDVHGAGCQRSDPKTGNPADYPNGNGPQGDVVRIDNLVRCVRLGEVQQVSGGSCQSIPSPEPCGNVDPGDPCCGDGSCDWLETTTNCANDCSGGNSDDTCEVDADCLEAGMCPKEATKGCACHQNKEGNLSCIPACDVADDCPAGPGGGDMICTQTNICVPGGGPGA